jgi:sulfate permease, SulP family
VREQTAELASLALSDAASGYSGTPPPKRAPLFLLGEAPPNVASSFDEQQGQDNDSSQQPTETSRPKAIEELPEPESPEAEITEAPQGRSPGASALTEMLRSSPLDDVSLGLNGYHVEDGSGRRKPPSVVLDGQSVSDDTEQTSLMQKHPSSASHTMPIYGTIDDIEASRSAQDSRSAILKAKYQQSLNSLDTFRRVILHPKSWDSKVIWNQGIVYPASLLPAVFLGLLLNILDALSYGKLA